MTSSSKIERLTACNESMVTVSADSQALSPMRNRGIPQRLVASVSDKRLTNPFITPPYPPDRGLVWTKSGPFVVLNDDSPVVG